MTEPHQPINMIPTRGATPARNENASPRMPASPGFGDITRPPMSPPTPFNNVQPLNVPQGDGYTGGTAIPQPASAPPSPAVRPFR